MSEAPFSSELSKRFRTGIPLAAGVALIVFAPTFIVGLVVLVLAFIGAQELTAMLAGKEENTNTTVLLPEWLLPSAAEIPTRSARKFWLIVRGSSAFAHMTTFD